MKACAFPKKGTTFPNKKKNELNAISKLTFSNVPEVIQFSPFSLLKLPSVLPASWLPLMSAEIQPSPVRGLIRRIIGQIDAVACACESNCSDWRNFSMAYRGFPEEIRSIWFAEKMACEEFRGRLGGIVDWVWVWNSVNFTWRRWNAWNRINLQRTFQVRTSTFKFQIMFTKLSEVCMAASI